MSLTTNNAYQNLNPYFGDIHNHCNLSYGNGSLEDALNNARIQLDFASITVHAVWPDLPLDDPKLEYLIDYHREGFVKAQANWASYLESLEQANDAGRFVTFPSFEWHSIKYGDYCIYYKQTHQTPIIDAPDLPTLRDRLLQLPGSAILIPHHIGYKQGSRGINWGAFTDDLSPVAEIFSFHGLAESSEGSYPYLHSMGPRHEHSTAQYGWSQGKLFGVVGSTDHHNSVPGSYGYGRMGVWADELSRDSVWEAICKRRTYALTGDCIELQFSLNDACMGEVCPPEVDRWVDVAVCGGASIDYIEVLHNNRVIHRESVLQEPTGDDMYKVYIEMGWAEQVRPFPWDVSLKVTNGVLHDVEPRLRGHAPTGTPLDTDFAYTKLKFDDNVVCIQTRTRQNPSLHTAATEGLSLEIEGTPETLLTATINGEEQRIQLAELMTGSRTFYTGGFVSPAISFHRAVPQREYVHRFAFNHHNQTSQRDWYYVRVRQRNDQWAWSSRSGSNPRHDELR